MTVNNFSTQAVVNYCTMRIFGPFWNNGGMKDPSGKQAGMRYARTDANNYDAAASWVQVLGRGIATMRLSSFAQSGLWIDDGYDPQIPVFDNWQQAVEDELTTE